MMIDTKNTQNPTSSSSSSSSSSSTTLTLSPSAKSSYPHNRRIANPTEVGGFPVVNISLSELKERSDLGSGGGLFDPEPEDGEDDATIGRGRIIGGAGGGRHVGDLSVSGRGASEVLVLHSLSTPTSSSSSASSSLNVHTGVDDEGTIEKILSHSPSVELGTAVLMEQNKLLRAKVRLLLFLF